MKHLALGLFALFLSLGALASEGGSKAEKDRAAQEALLNLHFFRDGRGIHLTPGVMNLPEVLWKAIAPGTMKQLLENRWGFNFVDKKPIGIFNVPYEGMKVGVLGCVACHSGKAAGVFIPGLGNKNIDPFQVGKDAVRVQELYDQYFGKSDNPIYAEVRDSALRFANILNMERIGNQTQGLVSIAIIRTWFYRNTGKDLPMDVTRGAVKVPAFWGYGEKRKVGSFADGFGDGNFAGWAVAVELTAGQTPETVRSYFKEVDHAEEVLADLQPPRYPFTIDSVRAERGRQVFQRTCSGCHGTYEKDAEGYPVYQAPKWIPIEVVKTDTDRLDSNSDEFKHLVDTNPMSDVIKRTNLGRGYFAQRLTGIWARFPYLHNASVPNIEALLTPASQRPRVFSMIRAGEKERFNPETLGLTLAKTDKEAREILALLEKGDRRIYSVDKVGQGNQGHEFGVHLPAPDKRDLIEYLKTM